MKSYTFRGSPAEVGRAQGAVNPPAARAYLEEWQARRAGEGLGPDFGSPYFQQNLAFMRREFPDLIEQIAAFGEAAGMESFEQAYYCHLHWTGPAAEACSTLGIVLEDDGPALFSTNDIGPDNVDSIVEDTVVCVLPDARPRGLLGVGSQTHVTVMSAAVNEAGLAMGSNSGHRKFNPVVNPECLNIYFVVHLLAQHCSDCADVRHFVEQYRVSGQKGWNLAVVDAAGNILGLELESENIAISEAQDGLLLEVNHFQHPKLQAPSRAADPEFWEGPYYYNSQARVMHVAHYRPVFAQMRTLVDLVDFSFDVHASGRLVQLPGRNLGNLISCQVVFASARERTIRLHLHPVHKSDYEEFQYPQ
ncbi:MAG: hypothetical protein CL878_04525 [Dehalococcoidia bacterium]|nr:hypothetical protein [Dehalococcoidia bacterium]